MHRQGDFVRRGLFVQNPIVGVFEANSVVFKDAVHEHSVGLDPSWGFD